MTGGDPVTPPHTPKDAGGGGVHQGDVTNKDIHIDQGVVTGNNYGYNVIAGNITVAIEAGTSFTTNLRSLTSIAVIMSTKLGTVEDKVSSMSYTLRNINDLVAAQARDEGLTMEREGKGFALNGKGAIGLEGDRHEEDGESSILSMRCYRDLTKSSQGITVLFRDLDRRISDARGKIDSWNPAPEAQAVQQPREKRPLTEDERAQLFLSERDITDMGDDIECRKTEINMKFTLFEAVLRKDRLDDDDDSASNNGVIVKRTVLEMFKDLKSIVEYLLGRGPRPQVLGGNDQGQLGTNNPPLRPLPDKRPLVFPDVSRLTSLYVGWLFRKGRPPDSQSTSTRPSWESAVAIRMLYSTEDLFLKVLAQMAQRVKRNRTLRDDRRELLSSDGQKKLVVDLLRHQNAILQKDHPRLEWKLAGLDCSTRRNKGSTSRETRKIEVILKTQWLPDFQPSGPAADGRGGIPGSAGENRIPLGPGSAGVSARQAGMSVGRGTSDAAGRIGIQHSARQAHEEECFEDRHGRGRTVELQTSRRTHACPSRREAGTVKSRGVKVIRQPQLVIVKEGGKGKAKRKTEGDGSHHRQTSDGRRGKQFYIELRRPGIYGGSSSHDVSSAQSTSLPTSPGPSPRPGPRSSQATPISGLGISNTPARPAPAPIIRDNLPQMTTEEEAEIVEELFSEWEEVTDKKGKKRSRSSARFRERASDNRDYYARDMLNGDSDIGISRRLMRQVEIQSHLREERISSEMGMTSEMHRRTEERRAESRRMDEDRIRMSEMERRMPREREIVFEDNDVHFSVLPRRY